MCVFTAPSTLDLSTISYSWRRDGALQSGQTSSQRVFNSLSQSENNAVYTCQYMASSDYLNSIVDRTSPGHTIIITSMWIFNVVIYMAAKQEITIN